ncbi:MAG: cell filamentation protein Fic [Bacteroidetes bacterium 4572_112]|nr:MAG: cell filamentation protein Fic [Bacteroidetes bacterium 4572_112]
MKPPYIITNTIMTLIASISEQLGEVRAAHLYKPPTELRRRNRIKTIQSSLEIEGNTLSEKQISDLFDNKSVLAPQKDVIEVKNAIQVYNNLNKLDLYNLQSMCDAHAVLMDNLIDNAGHLRTTSFHYEFEFIHPFIDGNGRMGRLWQTLILKEYSPIFEFLPIEILIKANQEKYYRALELSDKQGQSTIFVEFMLGIIKIALGDLLKSQNVSLSNANRIQYFKEIIGSNYFSRQDYLRSFKNISSATASRDMKLAVDDGIIVKYGDKRTTKYRFESIK